MGIFDRAPVYCSHIETRWYRGSIGPLKNTFVALFLLFAQTQFNPYQLHFYPPMGLFR